jgi:hypothetical protein
MAFTNTKKAKIGSFFKARIRIRNTGIGTGHHHLLCVDSVHPWITYTRETEPLSAAWASRERKEEGRKTNYSSQIGRYNKFSVRYMHIFAAQVVTFRVQSITEYI